MPLPKGVVPRFYQESMFKAAQEALRTHKSILLEAPTGSGKSVLLAMIINAVMEKNELWKRENRVYVIVHQTFLLQQMAGHLDKWRIPHGLITSGKYERPGVTVHVCTYQSLIKRPPEKAPALFIIDEAHRSGSKSYLTLAAKFPKTKIIGVTASPERGDGKGLKYCPGLDFFGKNQGLYQVLIKCPHTMKELTEMGYLSPIKYYAPPLPGIDSVGVSMGDYKPEDIEKFLKEKGVYGDAIDHYEKIAPGTKCLVFNKTVAACYSFAESLNARGYRAAPLEGSQGKKQRADIIKRFESGELTHITTCKLVLEGFDMPSIESVLDLAPTLSRALWHQKKGRLARPAPGKEFGIYIDPVGNVAQNTRAGDIYEIVDWRFHGTGYNKKNRSQAAQDQYCPLCFAYIPPPGNKCPDCGADKVNTPKKEPKSKTMDGELVEVKPIPLYEREGEERKEIQEKISAAIQDKDISGLIEIGKFLVSKKRLPFWIYDKMNTKAKIIDIELLYRIQRQFGYKPGWVRYARSNLKRKKYEDESQYMGFDF